MAEIADADLNTLQLGMKLLSQLSGNPKSRAKLEEAVKEADPTYKTGEERARELLAPEFNAYEARLTAIEADKKTEAEAQKTRDDADAKTRMELAFSLLRKDEGLTDEGEDAVKRLMVERSIADPAAAFALFQKQNPVVEVASASYEPSRWSFDKDTVGIDVDGLWRDPDGWADQEAGRVLTDIRKTPAQG